VAVRGYNSVPVPPQEARLRCLLREPASTRRSRAQCTRTVEALPPPPCQHCWQPDGGVSARRAAFATGRPPLRRTSSPRGRRGFRAGRGSGRLGRLRASEPPGASRRRSKPLSPRHQSGGSRQLLAASDGLLAHLRDARCSQGQCVGVDAAVNGAVTGPGPDCLQHGCATRHGVCVETPSAGRLVRPSRSLTLRIAAGFMWLLHHAWSTMRLYVGALCGDDTASAAE